MEEKDLSRSRCNTYMFAGAVVCKTARVSDSVQVVVHS
jgi:hypothetical protein